MQAFPKMLPYFFISALAFYLFPLFVFDARNNIFLLLLILPIICILLTCFFGILNRFSLAHLLLPIGIGIMFLPSVFLFYNPTALLYGAIFAALSGLGMLLGNIIGYLMRRLSRSTRHSTGKPAGKTSSGNRASKRPSNSKAVSKAASKAASKPTGKAASKPTSKTGNKPVSKSASKSSSKKK